MPVVSVIEFCSGDAMRVGADMMMGLLRAIKLCLVDGAVALTISRLVVGGI
jgi:hypothetical protein